MDITKKIEELKATYQKQINSNSTLGAIEAVKELTELVPSEWSYHYTLSVLHSSLPTRDALEQALDTVNTGIGHVGTSPALLSLKAEILVQQYDGASALQLIEAAEKQYEINQEEIEKIETKLDLPKKIDSVESNLKTSQKFLNFLSKLRGQAQILNTGQVFLERFNNIEREIDNNKAKVIELLGIFSAVIAFVIISGQVALNFEDINDALIFICGFGLIQIIFASLISLLSNRLEVNIFKDIRLYILVLSAISIGILIYLTM